LKAGEYRALLATLGLTATGASRVFGVSPRASQRYARGEKPVPGPLARLVRLAVAHNIPVEVIAAAASERRGR